jgi:hypothetical protein
LSVRQQIAAFAFDDAARMSRTLLWKLCHDDGCHFYKEVELCDLVKAQKSA